VRSDEVVGEEAVAARDESGCDVLLQDADRPPFGSVECVEADHRAVHAHERHRRRAADEGVPFDANVLCLPVLARGLQWRAGICQPRAPAQIHTPGSNVFDTIAADDHVTASALGLHAIGAGAGRGRSVVEKVALNDTLAAAHHVNSRAPRAPALHWAAFHPEIHDP
jgi:hypothetical protein